jgi:hypothetical protein
LDLYTLSIKEKIMKASIVFATGLILAAGAVVGSINVAHAGAAGSAGSISAEFSAGNVLTGTAGAVAVGKTGAFSSGTSNGGTAGTPFIPAIPATLGVVQVGNPGDANFVAGVPPTALIPAVAATPGTPGEFTAVAAGYGGLLTVTGFNTGATTFTVADDAALATVQANLFDSTNKNSVNLLPSTVGVSLK